MNKIYRLIPSNFTGYRMLNRMLNDISRSVLEYLMEHGYFYTDMYPSYTGFHMSSDSLDIWSEYSDGDDWVFSIPQDRLYTWDETCQYLDEVIRRKQDMEWEQTTNRDGVRKSYETLQGTSQKTEFIENQIRYLSNRYGEHNLKEG